MFNKLDRVVFEEPVFESEESLGKQAVFNFLQLEGYYHCAQESAVIVKMGSLGFYKRLPRLQELFLQKLSLP